MNNFFQIFNYSLTQPLAWWGLGFVIWLIVFLLVSRSYGLWSWQGSFEMLSSKKTKPSSKTIRPPRYHGPLPKLHNAFVSSYPAKAWPFFCVFLLLSLFVAMGFGIWFFVMLLFWGALIVLIFIKHHKRQAKIVEQCPFFLRVLSRSMQAGYDFEQALEFVSKEIDSPLKEELIIIREDLRYFPLEKSLHNFAKRTNDKQIFFMSQSIELQIETGANLIEFLGKLSQIMEEKLKLQRDLKSFTSQGRMSAFIVAGLWPFSLAVFLVFAPNHVAVLFDTKAGNALVVSSLLLEMIGFFFVWKITNVKL